MNVRTPIHIDPLLAEVFELLHRMSICREDTPATRMAGEALHKLTKYEEKVRQQNEGKWMAWGFIYVLGNHAMPGIYKIGMTEKAPQERLEQLSSSTSVPMPFWMALYAQVKGALEVERALHKTFERERVNASREFFRAPIRDIREAIESHVADEALIHDIGYDWAACNEEQTEEHDEKMRIFFNQCHDPIYWPKSRRGFE